RSPLLVDRDNFEDVLARIAPELTVEWGGEKLTLRFRELDDFHPDHLFGLEPFGRLRELRDRLAEPSTFAAAAAELQGAREQRPAQPAAPPVSGADLLRQMMGEPARSAPPAPRESDWDRMLRDLVAPYGEARSDPRQPALIAQVDAAIAGEMRALLHQPRFQALESAWRGLYFLIRRLETGEDLQVYVADLPQSEWDDLERIAVTEAARTPGAEPWAAIAGLYSFGSADEESLLCLSGIAQRAGAPFLAGLAPDVVGLTRVFDRLRRSPNAQWIGLALPRFLLRLPYGKHSDATERFAFEEMPAKPEHERYLWGNPAIACACLLGETFSRYGWSMRPGLIQDIESLPAHVYKEDGESQLKPCAEVLLTEDAAELLLDRGFMPLLSMKGTDRVRLARFQSVADPAAPLAGRWQ
ncbi:MAG TPA: type VI secretion system contractile sheath large subunit, partial [Bryobacteraceae bacterium]|nr:type VI secretion system contractile sheath large subunit [Bryobacteraceae bacterium]